jgi:adenylate cyclase
MPTEERQLAAIIFTDMIGYSAMAQRDEARALELLEEHRQIVREILARFHGTEIKTIGDAFLLQFRSALEAVQCAIEVQRTFAKRNHDVPGERRIELRIGIHLGDVVHRDGDVYGDGVNIASRIEPLAAAGGICISEDVERQVRSAVDVRVEKIPPTELKNIQLPMSIFRLVLPWQLSKSESKSEIGQKPRRSAATRWSGIGALLLVAIGLAWWFAHQSSKPVASAPGVATSRATTARDQKSIAVLPFLNMSADKGDEYLSDGMTEELLNVLTKVKGLRVPGRSSSFAFKGRNEDGIFRKVGEQLHVDAVLEGSVRKAGDKLRITAQLINVADGFHLWSETYDRDMKDILAVQSDVAQRVVKALKCSSAWTRRARSRKNRRRMRKPTGSIYSAAIISPSSRASDGPTRFTTSIRRCRWIPLTHWPIADWLILTAGPADRLWRGRKPGPGKRNSRSRRSRSIQTSLTRTFRSESHSSARWIFVARRTNSNAPFN